MRVRRLVDESVYHFFDFEQEDGNSCQGAFGIPISQSDGFRQSMATAISTTETRFCGIRIASQEFKRTELYQLPFETRKPFATALDKAF